MIKWVFSLTFIILAPLAVAQDGDSMNDQTSLSIHQHSIYIGTHFLTADVFYDRVIPFADRSSFIGGIGLIQGIAFGTATNPIIKSAYMYGKGKHYGELGVLIAPLRDDLQALVPQIAYRFQNPSGFLLKIDLVIAVDHGTYKDGSGTWTEVYPLPGFAIGYSF